MLRTVTSLINRPSTIRDEKEIRLSLQPHPSLLPDSFLLDDGTFGGNEVFRVTVVATLRSLNLERSLFIEVLRLLSWVV